MLFLSICEIQNCIEILISITQSKYVVVTAAVSGNWSGLVSRNFIFEEKSAIQFLATFGNWLCSFHTHLRY